jgi:hypothetical protein
MAQNAGPSQTDNAEQLATAKRFFRREAEDLLRRYTEACQLTQKVDTTEIRAALQEYGLRVGENYDIRFVRDSSEIPFTGGAREVFNQIHSAENKDEALKIHQAMDDLSAHWARSSALSWPVAIAHVGVSNRIFTTPDMHWRDGRDLRPTHHTIYDLSLTGPLVIGAAAGGDRHLYRKYYPIFYAFQCGAYMMWQTQKRLLVATIPSFMRTDNRLRFHSEDGPAFVWLGGEDYYWHGVRVPSKVILRPQEINVYEIRAQTNVEIRRAMIERIGDDKWIEMTGMRPIDYNPVFGTLYVEHFASGRPIARLRVTNRTAEPDGTFKTYWLPINPDLYDGSAGRFAQAASASMWRTTPGGSKLFFPDWRDYQPDIET